MHSPNLSLLAFHSAAMATSCKCLGPLVRQHCHVTLSCQGSVSLQIISKNEKLRHGQACLREGHSKRVIEQGRPLTVHRLSEAYCTQKWQWLSQKINKLLFMIGWLYTVSMHIFKSLDLPTFVRLMTSIIIFRHFLSLIAVLSILYNFNHIYYSYFRYFILVSYSFNSIIYSYFLLLFYYNYVFYKTSCKYYFK